MNMYAYLRYQFWKLTQSRNSITLSSIAYSAYTHVVVQHVFSFKYDYGMAYLVVKQCKPVQCVACSWYNCLQCITTSKEVNIQAQARPSLRYLGQRYDLQPLRRLKVLILKWLLPIQRNRPFLRRMDIFQEIRLFLSTLCA